jgi:uridine kinase
MKPAVVTVGICGGSASGKSVLSKYLVDGLNGEAVVFCQDWYYKDNGGLSKADAEKLNFDHPSAVEFPLLVAHLDALKRGEAVDAPVYEYVSHARIGTQRLEPRPVLIVDGLFVLQNRKLRSRLDMSVFIEVPADERLLRRVRRDVTERRVDLEETLRLYESFVRPMHDEFIQPSAEYATYRWSQLDRETYRAEILSAVQGRLRAARSSAG